MESAILSSVTEGIIGRLSDAAVREIGRLWGVNVELSGLEGTILTIKAVLVDAEEKQVHNNQVKAWLSRLEDVVNEADDLVDEVYAEALRRQAMTGNNIAKKVRTFFSTSNQLVFRDKMSRKIEGIKKNLVEIRDDRTFHLEERHREGSQFVYRPRDHTHSFISPKDVLIGRGDDTTKILELLLETKSDLKENVSVVPVVGSGGLGKTTLAKHVFNDEKVRKHFDLQMWVCVSDKDTGFDVKLLVGKIIRSIKNNFTVKNQEDMELLQDMESLQKKLCKLISGKRYLLVLDDVWTEERGLWSALEDLLLSGAGGSRILVTTRSLKFAKVAGTKAYIVGNLDEKDSWTLFKQMAFKQGQEPSDSIVEMAKMVAKRCGGNPLAIKTIGRMLHSEYEETELLSFYREGFSKMSQEETDILPTLKLSYDHLPSNLKSCFAYCSLFPKDHQINVKRLIRLWIAQGFVKVSDTTKSLEDVGHEYFMELYSRSFFQDIKEDEFGDIQYCKMHDLMHDLAMNVAGVACVMLPPPPEDTRSLADERSRHLSFDFTLKSSKQIPSCSSQTAANARIRTILLPSQRWGEVEVEGTGGVSICDAIVSNFKLLRALDLHGTGIRTLPKSIGKLKHLRYLDLSRTRLRALPNSVTKLQNLQTLKLRWTGLRELPRDIKNLTSLRHLLFTLGSRLTHMPPGMGQMTNLQTLSQFALVREGTDPLKHNSKVGELKDLMHLNNLRGGLEITNLKPGNLMDGSVANLKEKQNLQSLMLGWSLPDGNIVVDHYEDAANHKMALESLQPHPNLKGLELRYYGGDSLSNWFTSLKQLVRLRLKGCKNCRTLPPLDKFPSLKHVLLIDMPGMVYISNDAEPKLLSSLQNLSLHDLPNLKGWWRRRGRDNVVVTEEEDEEDAQLMEANCMFPCLSSVLIRDCPKLKFMLLCPSLTALRLEDSTWKPFHQTMMTMASQTPHTMTDDETSSSLLSSTTSSSSTPLPLVVTSTLSQLIPNLRSLVLCGIEDLPSLPDWFRSLGSLTSLSIWDCPKLKYLSPNIRHLSSLNRLSICGCNELDFSNNEEVIAWQAIKSLAELRLRNLPQLETLPEGLQYATALRKLFIDGCNNLVAIPEWISSLTSLTDVEIWGCPNLTSLPDGIGCIPSLQSLSIGGCPDLCRSCQRDGEDWPKIAHIPRLHIHKDVSQSSVSSSGISNWKISRKFRLPLLCNK